MEVLSQVLFIISRTIELYYYLLIITILLSWFPNLDRTNPIVSNLMAITEPYLNLFRGIIPPIAGLDLSPILAFISINLIQKLFIGLALTLLNSSPQFYN